MKEIQNTLTFARCFLSNKVKRFIFEAFDSNIEYIIDILRNKVEFPTTKEINNEIKATLINNCNFITLNDVNYPVFLRETDISPIILSVKGNKNICRQNNIIASSGTRTPETEDIQTINNILTNLQDNFIIASGLAVGSDTISHLQCYKTGSIAVLANGLRHCYPKENQFLIDKIIENGGCILSEYNYNTQPTQAYFLQRDKLLAGISASTLIMRARQVKSGTIATANSARNLDRKIYTFLPENGENFGNKWLLENNYATQITNLEELKYNLLIDIAELQAKIENKNTQPVPVNNQQNTELFTSQNKTDYRDKTAIINEIESILKLHKTTNITFNNLIKIHQNICKTQPAFQNNNLVKQVLIEKINNKE